MAHISRRQLLTSAAAALCTPFAAHAGSQRKTYLRAWKAQTRKLIIYKGFGTALAVRVTWLSDGFRPVLADERNRLIGDADAGDDTFRDRMRTDGRQYHEFIIGADSGEPERPKFGNTDARWNLQLTAAGQSHGLVEVEHIRRPTPVHRGLYPQLNIWSELWIARFERGESNSPLSLAVGSGLGNGIVRWP
jgi:hypothetical protein